MSFIELTDVTKFYSGSSQPAVNHLHLKIEKGEIVTLLGPSGCGKTTTLRMIAGFEKATSGTITIDGTVVDQGHYALAPEKRGIGMVFQDYALFPHLTIEKNVMFGLTRMTKKARKKRAEEVLNLVELLPYKDRFPHELSGGQQQRIALARALAPNPYVILMDEPFSNLDASLREQMRQDVTDILRKANTTAILVSHDQKDAFVVSDRVVVMNQGVIQQIATPKDMYRCPRNCFVAQFIGKTNLLQGTLEADQKHVLTPIGRICLPEKTDQAMTDVHLSVRPEACVINKQGEGRYHGMIDRVMYSGEYQEVFLHLDGDHTREPIVLYVSIDEDVQVGSRLSFDIRSEMVTLVEA
ncbi:iron(III) ABC transporter ATP-binding protein [Halolactibacillus alkaliphilus]|uniref:Carnitine transport ATP-binding protein OpuCA n=1 Tax=Halolactibacillus alkaliphilus TaxID=442899 RepID=A0A511X012_9BACI|nr:ABC transporter ATP-binding protein [Halolactibacillus alkaliphilus]GEN56283.1 iron(III) ABC transporter ATP-binding protein [Halolactibacillus alkaliphilus]GGN66220.1 iron(III) ABC transporter ATP-binding protein [Halolactibacillus alkaliphilus]SFO67320.1 iron(III) transport system ATP-binding protein [Halolactibacillus alkaliphilus]